MPPKEETLIEAELMVLQMGRTLEGWMGVYHADDTLTMDFTNRGILAPS